MPLFCPAGTTNASGWVTLGGTCTVTNYLLTTQFVIQGPWAHSNSAITSTSNTNWVFYDEVANWGWPRRAPGILSAKTRRRMRREQLEWARMQEEMNRAAAQRLQEGERARDRARQLLHLALTRDQQRSLEERRFFDMNVNGRTYRIHYGTHGNVRLIQGGVETRLYCAQPNGVPTEDAMLAQKLMLETDEPAFLRVANERILRAA